MVKCANKDCSIDWWHAVCAEFNNKDISKNQFESLEGWTCPCCVINKLHLPEYFSNSDDSELILKVEQKLEELKSEINDLKEIKQKLADMKKHQVEDKRLWSEIVASSNGDVMQNPLPLVLPRKCYINPKIPS